MFVLPAFALSMDARIGSVIIPLLEVSRKILRIMRTFLRSCYGLCMGKVNNFSYLFE